MWKDWISKIPTHDFSINVCIITNFAPKCPDRRSPWKPATSYDSTLITLQREEPLLYESWRIPTQKIVYFNKSKCMASGKPWTRFRSNDASRRELSIILIAWSCFCSFLWVRGRKFEMSNNSRFCKKCATLQILDMDRCVCVNVGSTSH